jgi:hypothetical protein
MSSLTADILSKSLLELLEMSESNGPGLISIPDIINKMQRTMKKLRHLRTIGGGVIVYVKNTVNCTIRPDLHVGSLECIWLEIKLNNKKILVRHILYPTN